MSDIPSSDTSVAAAPKWRALDALGRRILGVLVEKAKTTPDNYPLSINAIVTGCNQKNNRDPLMEVNEEEVEDGLDKLRGLGAIAEVHGSGRVVKYRHYMKEWLGVDGVELAVMTELLLRGAQTVGDLRGRAARMAPGQIADVASLRPILDALLKKNLVLELSPPGRGQFVSHALYLPDELPYLKARVSKLMAAELANAGNSASHMEPNSPALRSTAIRTSTSSADSAQLEVLQKELADLKAEVARIKQEVNDIWGNIR
jgi:uncharacterized protein